jgi:serine/threonine protein kinase
MMVLLEYAEHGALRSFLHTHEVNDVQRVKFVIDCCTGLEYLHSRKFIHRDIASRNVLISSDFTCKIAGE